MKDKWYYISCFAGLLLLTSCGNDASVLTAEEKYAVDSIYARQFNTLKNKSDSICMIISDTLYHRMVDSLTAEYMKELEYLLKDHITEE
jgi:hypothetical protein